MQRPLIIDTDLGADIDDAWALLYLLRKKAPISLIHVTDRNTPEKAALVAKILQIANRTDIPISVGRATSENPTCLQDWLHDFNLSTYPGQIINNGLLALHNALHKQSADLLCLSPASSVAAIIKQNVDISSIRLTAMGGSIQKGFDGNPQPCVEWNVKQDINSFKTMLNANWQSITLVPLDACTGAIIADQNFASLTHSSAWPAVTIMSAYQNWQSRHNHLALNKSSTLFDVVAADVWLHTPQGHTQELKLAVNNNGMIENTPQGQPIKCYMSYPTEELLQRLTTTLTATEKD